MSIRIRARKDEVDCDTLITSVYFGGNFVGSLYLNKEQLKELEDVVRAGEYLLKGADDAAKIIKSYKPQLKLVKNSDSEDDGA